MAPHALSALQVESRFADLAVSVLPGNAVLHRTTVIYKFVVLRASGALQIFDVLAAFDFALAALEPEVREAVSALSSLVADAAIFHGLADAFSSQEESAVAGDTFVVVVGLAVVDFAVAVAENEWLVAFFADVIDFILAAEDRVYDADVVVETVAVCAIGADLLSLISEFSAVLDGLDASSSFQEKV